MCAAISSTCSAVRTASLRIACASGCSRIVISSPSSHRLPPLFYPASPAWNTRIDYSRIKQVEQGGQVLSKHCRPQPFERLDAIGYYPSPAWEEPAANNVQAKDGDAPKGMATT